MFEFTSSLFFWSLINFAVLLGLVYKFALPPLFKMAEESEEKKRRLMEELERNSAESQRLMTEYQAKIAGIEEEARQILAEARREKDEIKKQELERILAEKQMVLAKIREELAYEKKKFVEEMKEKAADLIVTTAKKVLRKEMTVKDHKALIQENIEDFATLIK